MATKPIISADGAGPQHFTPPSLRERRGQAVHRLQIGLFGLAAMLLLVGLANIIMERALLAESANPSPAGITSAAPANSDPLADIGVIPSPDPARAAPLSAPVPAN